MKKFFLKSLKILEPIYPNKSTGIINGKTSGILNWNDIPYPSFYRSYKELSTNYWIPDEVDMKLDSKQYITLYKNEKYAFNLIISLLASLDSPQTRFIYNIAEYVTDPSVHANAALIAMQEVIHNQSYSYVLSSITTLQDQNNIFDLARKNHKIITRNKPIMKAYQSFLKKKNIYTIIKALIQSLILEGINFYSGFAFFYNLVRKNKMTGTGKIINFINRDELVHTKFISELIRAIIGENKILQQDFIYSYIYESLKNAVELEIDWSNEILYKIDGIDLNEMNNYIKYRANKIASMLGIDKIYNINNNVMPWINAYIDNFNQTKTDFFEIKNSNYKKTSIENRFDDL